MSYWHTCPACCRDIARRRYDEPNRGTLCAHCEWSPLYRFAYERGVADTVRAFWAAVCEEEARHHERVAASERRLNRMLGVNICRAADEHEVIAAQYRAWAREGG